MNKRLAVVALCAMISAAAAVDEPSSYLCAPDMATGFIFDKTTGQWHGANFRATQKYVVSRSKTAKSEWEVKEVGSPLPQAFCISNPKWNPQALLCEGPTANFWMDRKNLRYLNVYPHGWWDVGQDVGVEHLFGVREGDDTPYIEIGKCTPMQ